MLRTIIFVFLAAASAIILFTTIQDELPDELSFLKNSGKYSTGVPKDALGALLPSKYVATYKGWGVFSDDERMVATTKLTSTTAASEKKLPAELHLYYECTNAGPAVKLILANGIPYPAKQATVSVSFGPSSVSNWDLVQGRILAQHPAHLVGAFASNPLAISLQDANGKTELFGLDTSALPAITANLPSACRL